MHSIAILGGTFDPVHNGHLSTSICIQDTYRFDSYYFLPCKSPTLKNPALATPEQRLTMLELALNAHKEFTIDSRELYRDSPSYMVETLTSYRQEFKDSSINLILGFDAFITLPQWWHWEEIIVLANLLVINRTASTIPAKLTAFISKHQLNQSMELKNIKNGALDFFDAGNFPISSTNIREKIKQGLIKEVQEDLPKAVYDYIRSHELYR